MGERTTTVTRPAATPNEHWSTGETTVIAAVCFLVAALFFLGALAFRSGQIDILQHARRLKETQNASTVAGTPSAGASADKEDLGPSSPNHDLFVPVFAIDDSAK